MFRSPPSMLNFLMVIEMKKTELEEITVEPIHRIYCNGNFGVFMFRNYETAEEFKAVVEVKANKIQRNNIYLLKGCFSFNEKYDEYQFQVESVEELENNSIDGKAGTLDCFNIERWEDWNGKEYYIPNSYYCEFNNNETGDIGNCRVVLPSSLKKTFKTGWHQYTIVGKWREDFDDRWFEGVSITGVKNNKNVDEINETAQESSSGYHSYLREMESPKLDFL